MSLPLNLRAGLAALISVIAVGTVGFMFIGVPVRIGRKGIVEIVEVDLTDSERELLKDSAEHVRSNLEALERIQQPQA